MPMPTRGRPPGSKNKTTEAPAENPLGQPAPFATPAPGLPNLGNLLGNTPPPQAQAPAQSPLGPSNGHAIGNLLGGAAATTAAEVTKQMESVLDKAAGAVPDTQVVTARLEQAMTQLQKTTEAKLQELQTSNMTLAAEVKEGMVALAALVQAAQTSINGLLTEGISSLQRLWEGEVHAPAPPAPVPPAPQAAAPAAPVPTPSNTLYWVAPGAKASVITAAAQALCAGWGNLDGTEKTIAAIGAALAPYVAERGIVDPVAFLVYFSIGNPATGSAHPVPADWIAQRGAVLAQALGQS